jgi:hypothetical protein
MQRRLAIAFGILLCCGLPVFAGGSFTIRAVKAPQLDVRYFLTGPFGGYGGAVPQADKDGAYRIPLFVDQKMERVAETGTPAEGLKIILYAPGCQFRVLSVNLAVSSVRDATFECSPLSTIKLRGVIPAYVADDRRAHVAVLYMADWDHQFFGFKDGFVDEFQVAEAPIDAAGRFEITIPDFSKDPVTAVMQDAYLEVLLTGDSHTKLLLPTSDYVSRGSELEILPHYDAEIEFHQLSLN